MKNRFQTYIFKNMEPFTWLTPEEVDKFKKKTISRDGNVKLAATQKRANQRYFFHEDKLIVDFIAKKNAYKKVGGNKLWMEMADKKVARDRSWQSMKLRSYREVGFIIVKVSKKSQKKVLKKVLNILSTFLSTQKSAQKSSFVEYC